MFIPFWPVKFFPRHHPITVLVLTSKGPLRHDLEQFRLQEIPEKRRCNDKWECMIRRGVTVIWRCKEGCKRVYREENQSFNCFLSCLYLLGRAWYLPVHFCLLDTMVTVEINVPPHVHRRFSLAHWGEFHVVTEGHSLHAHRRGDDQTTTFTHTYAWRIRVEGGWGCQVGVIR